MSLALTLMLAFGGVFTGSITMIAWNRVPTWRHMPDVEFKKDFAETLRVADKLQPALLVLTLLSTLWFAWMAYGAAQVVAFAAAFVLAVILAFSAIIMVPFQNRLVRLHNNDAAVETKQLHGMRQLWLTRHVVRSALSAVALLLIMVAAAW